MFDWIDVDQGGSISFEDFVNGFDWLNEAVTGKALLKLESAVRQRCCTLDKQVDQVKERFSIVEGLAKSQTEEAKEALREAKERFEAEADQRLQEAEQLEAEARATRAEADRCRQHYAARVASQSAAMGFDESEEAEWASNETARSMGLRSKGQVPRKTPAPGPPPAEPRTLTAIAHRLRNTLAANSPSPTRWRMKSPMGRTRAPRWLEEEHQ